MEIGLDGTVVRTICKAVACAGKIGNEILLEVVAGDSLCLRSLNPARSAFFNVKIRVDAFEYFRVSESLVQVAVATKAFLAALRTPKVHNIRLTLEGANRDKLCFQLESETTGLRKKYSIPTLDDVEFLNTMIDKHTFPTRFITRPEVLSRLLSNFQSGATDMTIVCKPADGNKNLTFTSHATSFKGTGDAFLQTHMELDTNDEDIEYFFNSNEPLDFSFNLKDFKAMVQFCSDVNTDIAVYLDQPGSPVVVSPSFRRWTHHRAESDFMADMLLASMEPANQPTNSAPASQMNLSQRSAEAPVSGASDRSSLDQSTGQLPVDRRQSAAQSAAAPAADRRSTVDRSAGQSAAVQSAGRGATWRSREGPEEAMAIPSARNSTATAKRRPDEEMANNDEPTTMCYQQQANPPAECQRTYRTNRRASAPMNREGDVRAWEGAEQVMEQDPRLAPRHSPHQGPPPTTVQQGECTVQPAPLDQSHPHSMEVESEDSEDEEVLATPPDKRARYQN